MKLVSPLPHKRGRLEIIPLIDIMFFLLAAFIVVSIGKIHVKSLKISLPTDVPAAQKEPKEDFLSISINADGQVQLDKELVPSQDALLARFQEIYAKNKDQKFLISADKDSRHGDVMAVLGRLRSAGFEKIAFSIKNERTPLSTDATALPSAAPAPAVGAVSAAPQVPAASASPAALAPPPDAPSTVAPATAAPAAPAADASTTTAAPAAPTATAPGSPPAGN